ncbi:MAG: SulP family inorganic anion transporter [Actinobacteria bacterium]|nr:SulP family inorganic anion transporter [Actinomycetota bacterium]
MTDAQTDASASKWRSAVPILGWLPKYDRRAIAGDLLAGLVVAALAIPQSLGYATIAGVPVMVGLYSIPLALVAYAILGSSPHLVVGPVSTVSVLSGSLVADLASGDPLQAVALTSALAIGAGLGLVVGGVAKLGWAAEFMSRPIVTGFVFGLVLLIVVGEVPNLLGLPSESGDVFARALEIIANLGALDPLTAAIGVSSLIVLFAGGAFAPRVPWGLLVLIGTIVASSVWSWADRGVVTVGQVPAGLPGLSLPDVSVSALPALFTGGLALAMVGLAEGLSAARLFAAKEGYAIRTNQELVATGAANVASGLSGGMGVAGSLSKTAAMVRAGASSQVAGLAAAVIVLVVIAAFAGLLTALPKAALSAIVIQAVWGLMDVRALRRYQRIRRNDFNSALAAMLGVMVFGPLYGLLIAVGLAVLGLVYRSSRIDMEVMGKVPEEKAAWGSIRNHPERRTYDGVLVIRLDAPLFWANAAEIQDGIIAAVDADPTVRALVLDLEATSQLDTTSVDALELLLSQLQERGVELYLVRVFFGARRVLRRAGFDAKLGPDRMWHSIAAGVSAARKAAHLSGKAHAQEVEEADDTPGRERIAVDDANGFGNGDDEEPAVVPVGGYQDPYNAHRRRWWSRFAR